MKLNFKSIFILVLLILFTSARVLTFCERDIKSCGKRREYRAEEGVVKKFINRFRFKTAERVRAFIPSPHSELLMGVVLGIDDLDKVPKFNDVLISTGTIHIVVVSGYNVSLVFNSLIKVVGQPYKFNSLAVALFFAVVYTLITGFEPPVIRSLAMSSIFIWGRFYGRQLEATYTLILSGLVMIYLGPLFLFSLSFQLSFLATLGLLLFSEPISNYLSKVTGMTNILIEDFSSSISAQLLVWPLIAYSFERVSVLSAFVNSAVLWLIPNITMIGFIAVIFMNLNILLGNVMKIVIYPMLDIFVKLIEMFGNLLGSPSHITLSMNILLIYYVILFVIFFTLKYNSWLNKLD